MTERKILVYDDPLQNVSAWLEETERRSDGKKIQIAGAAQCLGEEMGEMEEAFILRDKPALADALGDITVASHALSLVLKREGGYYSGATDKLLPLSDHAAVAAIVAGQMCELGRGKGIRKRGITHYMDVCSQVRAFVRRLAEDQGIDLEAALESVYDQLERRLEEGYTISASGSAIKKSDQVAS